MRYFSYIESEDDLTIFKTFYSEEEIVEEFYDYWKTEMAGNGFSDLITKEGCIEDWCALHWAQPEDIYVHPNYEGKIWAINEHNLLDPEWNFASVVCLNDDIEIPGWVDLRTMRKVL